MKNFLKKLAIPLLVIGFIVSPIVAHADLSPVQSAWNFNESSGNAADSAGSNTLTNVNTATYSAGQINNAGNCASASSQYWDIADASQTGLDPSGSFSFSGWFKWTDFTGQDFIVTKDSIAAGLRGWAFSSTSGVLLIDESSDGTSSTEKNVSHSISTGTWTHIVFTNNVAAGTAYFYINGTKSAQITGLPTSIANTLAPFSVCTFGLAGGNFFNGSVDALQFFNYELSNAEVSSLYNGGVGKEYPFTSAVDQAAKFLQGMTY